MDKFLRKLKKELYKKNINKEEINDIVSYYQEIISDKLDEGYNIDDILKDFDIDDIVDNVESNNNYDDNKKNIKKLNDYSLWIKIPFLIVLYLMKILYVTFSVLVFVCGFVFVITFIISVISLFMIDLPIGIILIGIGGLIVGLTIAQMVINGLKYLSKYICDKLDFVNKEEFN